MPTRYSAGLCSVSFRTLDADEIITLATSCGLTAIEWGADGHVPIGDIATAREVRRQCERVGIDPASYGTYFRSGTGHADDHLAAIADTAVALGASNIRVWGGPRGVGSNAATHEIWRAAAGELRRLAEIAAPRGITLSLEFHADTLMDTGSSAVRLLESVGHPNLFSKWQPTPGISVDAALAEIEMIGPWLSYVDVFARDANGTRFPLADHAELWTAVFAQAAPAPAWALPPYALIEFVKDDSVEALRVDARFLKQLIEI